MEGFEQQIGAILSNPEMMQKLMAMAQSLGGSVPSAAPAPAPEPQRPDPPPAAPVSAMPLPDPAIVQALAGFARQGSIDPNEQALLKALRPYLSRNRIAKLEKAMRAAKLAQIASSVLGQRGQPFSSGR